MGISLELGNRQASHVFTHSSTTILLILLFALTSLAIGVTDEGTWLVNDS